MDPVGCIELLLSRGLWVTGGFIVGFDSDTEDIFEQQVRFIARMAIPWALVNFLHALPRTALYDRMHKTGRMLESRVSNSDGILSRYAFNRPKIWMSITLLISGQHFIPYAAEVARKVDAEMLEIEAAPELAVAAHM
jgi:radical SAM superfamily enzyme YgiQ (UPF0313 family)